MPTKEQMDIRLLFEHGNDSWEVTEVKEVDSTPCIDGTGVLEDILDQSFQAVTMAFADLDNPSSAARKCFQTVMQNNWLKRHGISMRRKGM